MNKENFNKAFLFGNIIVFCLTYAFVTRHIGNFIGIDIVGIILALIPSGISMKYYKQIKNNFLD